MRHISGHCGHSEAHYTHLHIINNTVEPLILSYSYTTTLRITLVWSYKRDGRS